MHKKDVAELSNWESFWKENPTGFNETMAQSTLFFAKNLDERYPVQPHDHFLDLGCGPGFFITYLKDKCELIHGTDISDQYITACEKQFADYANVSFSVTKAYDYKAYCNLIIEHKINRVVMLSVLQYYKNVDEVKNLILSLQSAAKQQRFNCLLADIIPSKHAAWSDIINIIKHSIKRGYTFKFMKFLFYAVFSDYRKIKRNGLLQIDESFFVALGAELGVDISIVKDLTLHTGRYSVFIDF